MQLKNSTVLITGANVLGMLRGSLAFAPVLERTCDGAFLDVASVASSRGVFGCALT